MPIPLTCWKRTSKPLRTPNCAKKPTVSETAPPGRREAGRSAPGSIRRRPRSVLAARSGMRHFDVQLMGGAALHLGNIAEMKTGEGKTLVATAPAYLNALTGKGVHVVTVNDYLAEYQSDLMGRVYRFLGLTSGCILSNQDPATAPRAVRRGHHLRHEQRIRLRLPARQHGVGQDRTGPARPPLRDRR